MKKYKNLILKKGLNMKFINKRHDETIYVYASGKGKDVQINIRYIPFYFYTPDAVQCIELDYEEAKQFIDTFKIALDDAEKRKEMNNEEDV